MRINKLQVEQNNKIQNKEKVRNQTFGLNPRSFVRTLANPDAFTSTVILETAVTGGRSYNAYKRGGQDELRERFIDDVLSAIFWMKGVDMFNFLGNKFGEYFLKLPITEFDVGKDALRTPFANVVEDMGKTGIDEEALKKLSKKLSTFKFTKIVLSTLLATGFVGFLLPKMNQAMTKKIMGKNKAIQTDKVQNKPATKNAEDTRYSSTFAVSMEDFEKNINSQKKTPSFGSAITTVAHYLENNKICKLLTSDVGIATGRFKSARNVDEGIEYLFRDSASSFFYTASTPLIYWGLQKLTDSSKYTTIDPVAAEQLHNKLMALIEQSGGKIAVDELSEKAIGVLDDSAVKIIENLSFEKGVISFDKLKEVMDDTLLEKALNLAKLQPEQAGVGAVLTKQQVQDVYKNGVMNTPEFMFEMFHEKFGDDLTNRAKYIPMKKITEFRQGMDDYVESVVKYAKKHNIDEVTQDVLKKLNKKSFIMSAGFRSVAIGISALALGIAIPKLQYAITKIRTGSSEAPGLREYNKQELKA